MDDFDDRPLERAPQNDPTPIHPSRKSLTPIALIAVVGLIAGALGAWWWTRGRAPAPVATSANASEAIVSQRDAPEPTLPPLDQMDTFLRALLGTLSSHPAFVRWLATDDLIRQMAHGIDRLSRGQSPAADLAVLRPEGDFEVRRQRVATTIDSASFARYNGLASLVDGLDPRAVADAYRTVRPRLNEAYRALGRSDGAVDDAVHVALQTLIDTPVPAEPVQVIPGKGATWAFKDPALENLSSAQKQLVRMGPDNMRRVQERLRAIRAELMRSDNRTR